MELLLTIGMIIGAYILCHLDEWRSDNRMTPPDMNMIITRQIMTLLRRESNIIINSIYKANMIKR